MYFFILLVRNEECDPVYSGAKSLSEQETAGLAKFLDSIALQMLAFINLRSFEYLITIPYGYDYETCYNYPVLVRIFNIYIIRNYDDYNDSYLMLMTTNFMFT